MMVIPHSEKNCGPGGEFSNDHLTCNLMTQRGCKVAISISALFCSHVFFVLRKPDKIRAVGAMEQLWREGGNLTLDNGSQGAIQ